MKVMQRYLLQVNLFEQYFNSFAALKKKNKNGYAQMSIKIINKNIPTILQPAK